MRLEVDADVLRQRLGDDPFAGRLADLEVALRDLESPAEDDGAIAVDGARPRAVVATDILGRLGWPGAT